MVQSHQLLLQNTIKKVAPRHHQLRDSIVDAKQFASDYTIALLHGKPHFQLVNRVEADIPIPMSTLTSF
jgi:hypothetical protein